VRDSSLSACTQAVMCARVGHLDLAHDYLHEAALVDLRDLHGNARDGLHMASMAGAWSALVDGFGGMTITDGLVSLDPQLPDGMTRLAFRLHWHGMRLLVEVTGSEVRLELRDGPDAEMHLLVAGEPVHLTTERPVVRPWTRRQPLLPRPPQPVGREPDTRE
jgi:trehalose/maltose hydrolase-like predicted phosphorylase